MPRRASALITALCALSGCTRVLELDPEAGVCVPERATGYRLPSARWALAAAHASHRLDDADDGIALSPSWFLATGWQATGFGCADYGAPWTGAEDPGESGCLAIRQGTTWHELTVLYPGHYPSDEAYVGAVDGDQPEAAAMALAWATVAAHALWAREGVETVPAEWYATAGDPHAAEAMSAFLHVDGPWSSDAATALAECADDVAACARPGVDLHIRGVVEKTDLLDRAPCYDEPLEAEVVEAHVDALAAIWPDRDWEDARAAALDALDGSGFRTQVPAVLDALDTHLDTRLRCPEQTLWQVYRSSCP